MKQEILCNSEIKKNGNFRNICLNYDWSGKFCVIRKLGKIGISGIYTCLNCVWSGKFCVISEIKKNGNNRNICLNYDWIGYGDFSVICIKWEYYKNGKMRNINIHNFAGLFYIFLIYVLLQKKLGKLGMCV